MPVALKGTPQGLRLIPKTQAWPDIFEALKRSLADAGDFFKGGRVIVELNDFSIDEDALLTLRELLETHGLELWTILSEQEDVQRLARIYSIRTRLPTQQNAPVARPPVECDARYIKRTLRSGQRLETPGNLTLIGDVNSGAELVAGGDIVIWGRARGVVHAGAFGDDSAKIHGLDLKSAQLRIAGIIGEFSRPKRQQAQAQMAYLVDGALVIKPWTTKE